MTTQYGLTCAFLFFAANMALPKSRACCPAPPPDKLVVNADQTVIIIWDPATKMEHFIRKATFKSNGDDFGFLIATPKEPELSESGNDAFPFLKKLTEPDVVRSSGGMSCACSKEVKSGSGASAPPPAVRVLAEKEVAGFHAVVLEATGAQPLVDRLKEHGYALSPQVADWAKPYIEGGWKITALKVAKSRETAEQKKVAAAALRLSFKTDRPLFPYREPNYKGAADSLGATSRLLRIYFISDARYGGELTKDDPWTGTVAWSNRISPEDRKTALGLLKLQEADGPDSWWLTEFEDPWPYRAAPADLYFAKSDSKLTVKRPPVYASESTPGDVTVFAIVAVFVVPAMLCWKRGTRDWNRDGLQS